MKKNHFLFSLSRHDLHLYPDNGPFPFPFLCTTTSHHHIHPFSALCDANYNLLGPLRIWQHNAKSVLTTVGGYYSAQLRILRLHYYAMQKRDIPNARRSLLPYTLRYSIAKGPSLFMQPKLIPQAKFCKGSFSYKCGYTPTTVLYSQPPSQRRSESSKRCIFHSRLENFFFPFPFLVLLLIAWNDIRCRKEEG